MMKKFLQIAVVLVILALVGGFASQALAGGGYPGQASGYFGGGNGFQFQGVSKVNPYQNQYPFQYQYQSPKPAKWNPYQFQSPKPFPFPGQNYYPY